MSAAPKVNEMKRAAVLVEHENFMGLCAGGMPLIGGKACEFCGADYHEQCKRQFSGGTCSGGE